MKDRVMVVDDEPITRLDIKEMLEERGYNLVGEAKNGEEAIEKAKHLAPNLIIMDIKMPILDGIKASSIIKKQSDCAILLLTAYSDQELTVKAKKAGVTGYLVKPVKERELIPAVEIALSQREKELELSRKVALLEEKIEHRKKIEKAKGILMKVKGYSEEEAYRKIKKKSMETHVSMVKIAEQVMAKVNK